jgi:hypothetical protein
MCCQENALAETMAVFAMASLSDARSNNNNYICDVSPKEAEVSTDTIAVTVILFTTLCQSKYCFRIEYVVKKMPETVTVVILAVVSLRDAITNSHKTNCVASLKKAKVNTVTVTVAVTIIFFTTLCKCK